MKIGKVEIAEVDGAFAWIAGANIDADGAPDAYAPPGAAHPGRDFIGNAHKNPRDLSSPYVGVVTDANGDPVVQGAGDPVPGDLVPGTSLKDLTKAQRDPRRYVDSSVVPYYVLPPELRDLGLDFGDLGYGVHVQTHRCQGLIAGDGGPRGKIGEVSIAGADGLGVPSSPKNGGTDQRVIAVVFFPESRSDPAWPRDVNEFCAAAAARLTAWGGLQRLLGLYGG
jgi:hypothetical protein